MAQEQKTGSDSTQQNTHVSVVSEVSRPWWQSRRFLLVLVGVVIVVAGSVFAYITLRPTDTSNDEAAIKLQEERATQKATEDIKQLENQTQPTSKEEQFNSAQQQVTTLQEPDNSEQSLQTYSDAAFAGARVGSPEAKVYAAKALELFPKDEETRAMYANQIARLEAIERGEYETALN